MFQITVEALNAEGERQNLVMIINSQNFFLCDRIAHALEDICYPSSDGWKKQTSEVVEIRIQV